MRRPLSPLSENPADQGGRKQAPHGRTITTNPQPRPNWRRRLHRTPLENTLAGSNIEGRRNQIQHALTALSADGQHALVAAASALERLVGEVRAR